jgi:hypothetical protein
LLTVTPGTITEEGVAEAVIEYSVLFGGDKEIAAAVEIVTG